MFYISKDKKRIVDSNGNIVGFIENRKFVQTMKTNKDGRLHRCHPIYNTIMDGLSAIELEQISEIMQSNGYS